MKDRIRTLQPAVDVAHEREQAAARQHAQARARLDEQRVRLEQLLAFRAEYAERLHQDGRGGLSARRLHDYLVFIGNLDANIAQLRRQIEVHELEVAHARKAWQASRAKARALAEVIAHYRRESGRLEERREQAASDEFALQKHRDRQVP